jgi:hypothetical protein
LKVKGKMISLVVLGGGGFGVTCPPAAGEVVDAEVVVPEVPEAVAGVVELAGSDIVS